MEENGEKDRKGGMYTTLAFTPTYEILYKKPLPMPYSGTSQRSMML